MKVNSRRLALLKKAFAVNRLPCAICGLPIDYKAGANEHDAYELDHRLPKSKYS